MHNGHRAEWSITLRAREHHNLATCVTRAHVNDTLRTLEGDHAPQQ